jgi:hypothetical protein
MLRVFGPDSVGLSNPLRMSPYGISSGAKRTAGRARTPALLRVVLHPDPAFYAAHLSCHTLSLPAPADGRGRAVPRSTRGPPPTVDTWLILPVVICLSQRLSHACLSISNYTVKLRMAH